MSYCRTLGRRGYSFDIGGRHWWFCYITNYSRQLTHPMCLSINERPRPPNLFIPAHWPQYLSPPLVLAVIKRSFVAPAITPSKQPLAVHSVHLPLPLVEDLIRLKVVTCPMEHPVHKKALVPRAIRPYVPPITVDGTFSESSLVRFSAVPDAITLSVELVFGK